MKLDIILRTHDTSEVHVRPSKLRYPNVPKIEVIKKCVKSLVKSANLINDVNIICLDDHSTDDCKNALFDIFKLSRHPVTFKELECKGHNNSSYQQYLHARDSNADLVYCIEDDYLHCESALYEMLSDYKTFKTLTNNEVALHPFDDPDNYKDKFITDAKVVQGMNRHWRTNTYTTYSFLSSPRVVKNNWNVFYLISKNYLTEIGQKYNIHEGTTINKIWKTQVNLFTPLPSLALHVQYDENIDRLTDWKKWWNEV